MSKRFKYIVSICFLLISVSYSQVEQEGSDFSYALKLYNQSFYDIAAQQFIQFYTTYPASSQNGEARFFAGMSLFKLKDFVKARVEFQSIALELPKNSRAAEALYYSAQCLVQTDEQAEAARAFESIYLLYPASGFAAEGLYRSAEIFSMHGKEESAYINYKKLQERYPDSEFVAPAWYGIAEILYRQGQGAVAREYLDRLEATNPKGDVLASALLLSAKIEFQSGINEKALAELKRIIDIHEKSPAYIPAVRLYVLQLIRNNDLSQAQILLKKAIDKNPGKKNDLISALGDVHFLMSNFGLADIAYSEYQPENDSLRVVVHFKHALAKAKLNRYQTAQMEIRNDLDYENIPALLRASVYYHNAQWLIRAGKADEAGQFLRNLIIKKESNSELRTLLLKLLTENEEWNQIIRIFTPFTLDNNPLPDIDDIYYNLAYSHEMIKNYETAAQFYEKLMHNFGASELSGKAAERLQFLQDYRIVDLHVAVLKLAELISLQNNSGTDKKYNNYRLGVIYFNELKDYKTARSLFSQASDSNTAYYPDVQYYLGETTLKLAELAGETEKSELKSVAGQHFHESIKLAKTGSFTDLAAWYILQNKINTDSSSALDERKYLFALIAKYPKSKLLEEWYAALAENLSFAPELQIEARNYFELLTKDFPHSRNLPYYLYGYGKLIEADEPEAAVEKYKTIVRKFPESIPAATAVISLAEYYRHKGMNDVARQFYIKFESDYYYSDQIDYVREQHRNLLYESADYEELIRMLESRIDLNLVDDVVLKQELLPENIGDDLFILAKAYQEKDEMKKAIEYYSRFLSFQPDQVRADAVHFYLGQYYSAKGQFKTALRNFSAIKSDPELKKQAARHKAEIYFNTGDYRQCAQTYQAILAESADQPDLMELRAAYIIALIRQGDLKQSQFEMATFKKDYKKNETALAQFILELAEQQRLQKNYQTAIDYLEQIKKNYKSTPYIDDADYALALNYLVLNKNEKALEYLTDFSVKYPHSDKLADVNNTIGTLYFRGEKYEDALRAYKSALERNPDSALRASILSNLIKTYTFTGFWDAAQGTARQYIEEFPAAEDRLDKKILIARASINLNQYVTAIDYLKQIKTEADSEREPEIQYYIGEAYLKAGQYENAIAEFVKIPLLSIKTKLQWEASALYYSGQAYEKLGRTSDAIRMYQEIINRPGIDLTLKKEAEKRINQIKG